MKAATNQNKRGLWTKEEDRILLDYVRLHGTGKWNRIPKATGLKRGGKSCRLRWLNYLSPNLNRGDFTTDEDDLIIRLHKLLGNRWSLIAGRIPGRTDNQIKNHWNTHLCKKLGLNKESTKAVAFSDTSKTEAEEIHRPDNKSDLLQKNSLVMMGNDTFGESDKFGAGGAYLAEELVADIPWYYHGVLA